MNSPVPAPGFRVEIVGYAWTQNQAAMIKRQFEGMMVGTVANIVVVEPEVPADTLVTKAPIPAIEQTRFTPAIVAAMNETPAPAVPPTSSAMNPISESSSAPVVAKPSSPFPVGTQLRDKYAGWIVDVISSDDDAGSFVVKNTDATAPANAQQWPVPYGSAGCFEKVVSDSVSPTPDPALAAATPALAAVQPAKSSGEKHPKVSHPARKKSTAKKPATAKK